MVEAPVSDNEGFDSDVASSASEPPPDWNSDDEPPEDHIGDEHDCSRDGRVKKVIRRVGRGLDRPGQYDVVRVRWTPLLAGDGGGGGSPESGEAASRAASGGDAGVAGAAQELHVNMGEDKLPLAVEFALKTMRIGEIAEVRSPAAYAALASPLCGRKLRGRNGRMPKSGKVPRRRRFLPAAPRGVSAKAKLEAAQAKLDGMTAAKSDAAAEPGNDSEPPSFRARVELLGMTVVHMLTEDQSVSKTVIHAGRGRRMPRIGDMVSFSLAQPGEDGEGSGAEGPAQHTLCLGTDTLPEAGLHHVLLSMKLGERCMASLPAQDRATSSTSPPADIGDGDKALPARNFWRYDPPEERKLDFRSAPRADAPREAAGLLPGDIFEVSEEVNGEDGVTFLRLADGRGWVFDKLPNVGTLCARHDADPEKAAQRRLVVTLHSWRRRDDVAIPPPGAIGFRPDADERESWPSMQKLELRAGPERLIHEIEEGTQVLVALPGAGDKADAAGAGLRLLSWVLGEGAVPGFLDAAVASMRILEVAEFHTPAGKSLGMQLGPSYEGQTPLRRVEMPELATMLAFLLDTDFPGNAGTGAAEDSPEALPAPSDCSLRHDWQTVGTNSTWADVGFECTAEADSSFRLVLLGVGEPPDVCTMAQEEQQAYLERERAHGNALAKLGRFAEASAAYTRALDAVRRTAIYKAFFPTERGHIQGAYSRDAAQDQTVLERMSPEDVQARRTGFVALHLNLALCASKQGKAPEARRHASIALTADPDNAKALFRRGAAAAAHGDHDEALADLQRAVELQPQDRGIREELQALQRKMKEHRAAQKSMFQNVFKPASRKENPGPESTANEQAKQGEGEG